MNATIVTQEIQASQPLQSSSSCSGSSRDVFRNIPRHVAIVMDGNRRWARARGLPVTAGHLQGSLGIEPVIEEALRLGIRAVTFFAFSTENWSRPQEEIDLIFSLLTTHLEQRIDSSLQRGIRLRFIGDTESLPLAIKKVMDRAQEATSSCTQMTVLFAVNYGGRNELLRAVREIAARVEEGQLKADQIREWHLSEQLDTHSVGDPQLFIRTSGEQRLSNFLLWQSAYSELYFPKIYWPDFKPSHLVEAVEFFQTRERRFGV